MLLLLLLLLLFVLYSYVVFTTKFFLQNLFSQDFDRGCFLLFILGPKATEAISSAIKTAVVFSLIKDPTSVKLK